MVEFRTIVAFSQVSGLIMLGLIGLYTGKYSSGGGFDWNVAAKEFNYHPLFMVLGLIFLYGESILVYRVLQAVSKPTVKWIHTILHLIVLMMLIIGLIAVFDSHRNLAALGTIHGWVGIFVCLLFFFQFVCGFITFLKPQLEPASRKWYLPIHQYFGLALFQLAGLAVLTGITERLMSMKVWFGGENFTLNFLGMATIFFVFSVSHLVSTEKFRRPSPADSAPLQPTSYESLTR